ncbi:MAG: hypothetical protein LBD11_05890 [Candidatus Peribacteria bacterium]|nr:hypothetical protein [Candidatus Peribacteria bacterium]
MKVDGIFLVSGTDYNIIDSTGTLIELTETYLNTLIAGTKNLTIEFYGGVNINDAFTILSAPQCTNGATNYPACNNQTPPSGGSS